MAEWLKAHAWKACLPQGNVGSNPTLSAILESMVCMESGTIPVLIRCQRCLGVRVSQATRFPAVLEAR
jgi:hypothetical protein